MSTLPLLFRRKGVTGGVMEQDNRNLVTADGIREKIALRAYELYQDRGGQNGRDIDD